MCYACIAHIDIDEKLKYWTVEAAHGRPPLLLTGVAAVYEEHGTGREA
jgi:hypothetical protein